MLGGKREGKMRKRNNGGRRRRISRRHFRHEMGKCGYPEKKGEDIKKRRIRFPKGEG